MNKRVLGNIVLRLCSLVVLFSIVTTLFVTVKITPIMAETPSKRDNFETANPSSTYTERENYQFPSAQVFTASATYYATGASFKCYQSGDQPYDVTIGIWPLQSGHPQAPPSSATALCKGVVSGNSITNEAPGEWLYVDFTTPYQLQSGTSYALIVNSPGFLNLMGNIYNGYAGQFWEGSNQGYTWGTWANVDLLFRVYGSTAIDAPTIATSTLTDITSTSAIGGANITSNGGVTLTAKGVVVGTSANPTLSNTVFTASGTTTGVFTVAITGLDVSTTYHMRGYATNTGGTSYSDDVSFDTNAVAAPTVTTSTITAIGSTTATGGANVTSDGGGTISERGVCVKTSANPTTSDTKFTTTGTTGVFTASLTSLSSSTTYHMRGYAINAQGTSYSDDITFDTGPGDPPLLPTLFSSTSGDGQITFYWTKGSGAENTVIRGQIGSYPTNYDTGTSFYNGTASTYTKTGLTNGDNWYVRAWSYSAAGGYSVAYAQTINTASATHISFIHPYNYPAYYEATDGSYIYSFSGSYAGAGEISKLDKDTLALVGQWAYPNASGGIYCVYYDSAGFLYAGTNSLTGGPKVYKIDPSTMATSATWTCPDVTAGGIPAITSDSTDLYLGTYLASGSVSHIYKVSKSDFLTLDGTWNDVGQYGMIEQIAIYDGKLYACFDNGGPKYAIAYQIQVSDMTTLHYYNDGVSSGGDVLAYDGTYVYVGYASNNVIKLETSGFTKVDEWTKPAGETASVVNGLAWNGQRLVVGLGASGTYSKTYYVDQATMENMANIGDNPTVMNFNPTSQQFIGGMNTIDEFIYANLQHLSSMCESVKYKDPYYTSTTAPMVTASIAISIGSTTGIGGANVATDGGSVVTERGVCVGTSANPTTSDTKFATTGTTGIYTVSMTGLSTGTTYHLRGYAINAIGTSYGDDITFLTIPAVPTGLTASQNDSAKVVLGWDNTTGATGYNIYRNGSLLIAVATNSYNDTTASAPTINSSSVLITNNSANVGLSLSSTLVSNGSTQSYAITATNDSGEGSLTSIVNGFRISTTPTFQWNVSSGDAASDYSAIGGATTSTYSYTSAPAPTITAGNSVATNGTYNIILLSLSGVAFNNGDGRYYTCTITSTNASNTPLTATASRGYRVPGGPTYQWQQSAADSDAAYSNISGATGATYSGTVGVTSLTKRYYKCVIDAFGATQATSTADEGWWDASSPSLISNTAVAQTSWIIPLLLIVFAIMISLRLATSNGDTLDQQDSSFKITVIVIIAVILIIAVSMIVSMSSSFNGF